MDKFRRVETQTSRLHVSARHHVNPVVRLRLFLAIVPVAAILGQPSGQSGQYRLVNLSPNRDNATFAVLNIPPGPLKFRAVTLKKLIRDAYGVPELQITGGPPWVGTDRWDFEAQTDGQAPMATEVRRQMLLLTGRLLSAPGSSRNQSPADLRTGNGQQRPEPA
jgi:hypothetical protein